MVKIHFLQKVLKKWSSFRKKNNFFFHNRGEGSGPYIEFSIIFFFFFEPFPNAFSLKIMQYLNALEDQIRHSKIEHYGSLFIHLICFISIMHFIVGLVS